jgi:hypothetical protein
VSPLVLALTQAADALVAQRAALVAGDAAALEACHARLEPLLAGLSAPRGAPGELDPAVRRAAGRLRALARDNARLLVRARDLSRELGPGLRPTRLDRSA